MTAPDVDDQRPEQVSGHTSWIATSRQYDQHERVAGGEERERGALVVADLELVLGQDREGVGDG